MPPTIPLRTAEGLALGLRKHPNEGGDYFAGGRRPPCPP